VATRHPGFTAALLLALLLSTNAQAECECLWEGSFADVQASTSVVVSGTVLRGRGNSIDVQVDQLLRGKEKLPTIRIWLKTSNYCRPEPSVFPPDSQWVMALNRIDQEVPGGFNPNTPSISYGRVGDYILSSCGGYWLSNSEGWLTGNLVKAPRWVREPKMTPVLLDLVAAYVVGDVDIDTLVEASKVDPALRELMQDTKAFLRK
jgi:hypothetical protein